MRKKTLMIHGGISRDKTTGAVSIPVSHASTFKQDGVGNFKYEYARTGNPTREALETLICDLEGGVRGFAFSSGMAAISAVMHLFKSGDHIILTDDVYGGTFRLATKILSRYNIDISFVDTSDAQKVNEAIKLNTKAIYIESPTNPLLKITDIRKMAQIANENHLQLIVDNTFATPYWQNPIELGAHIVLHSATKYLGGHSDVVAGVVVVSSEELANEMHFVQNSVGAILGPDDSWLLIRGIKTLALRMEEIETNTKAIANFLQSHPKVKKVYYPGFSTHTGYDTHKNQSRGFGGMLSFDIGSGHLAEQVLAKTKLFTLAESLGAVESLISLPAKMTHASIPKEHREVLGITDGLIRISVGIEDVQDLLDDLAQAIE
ncbi:bifunctional cystathionine gamma-lyase/homocysteine desulfhydrase [Bacillus andreraoultii]|uniref:bifunctional cystathionine gamma-lyase/homocysteine desulfhydrase n=1 Tax=Bacillus andreraoultii TaxID=1499685 RepID=UPI00053A6498|nr:bifunctional cystathionine gamma-lyase/homocysteine desulfhydrase [Bacillus andreraoultii]